MKLSRMVLSTVSPASIEAERLPQPHNVRHELLMAAEENGKYFWGSQWLFSVYSERKVYPFVDYPAINDDSSILFAF